MRRDGHRFRARDRGETVHRLKIRERVVAHIEVEVTVARKNGSSCSRQPRPKESSRARPLWVNETSAKKITNSRYVSFVAKRNEPKTKAREEPVTQPQFRVS